MRPSRLAAALLLAALSSCNTGVEATGLAINDPLALIDDVEGPLRLYVLPDSFTCDSTTGMVSPEVPDLPEGMFVEAIADLSLPVMGSSAMADVDVGEGSYTVLVRGKGTDPVTMRPDVFIATGCASSAISAGETRAVRITLLPIIGMGLCGDGTLSPDEQCEDSNTTDGDGCSASCRTESFMLNTTTASVQNHASLGGAPGQRWTTTYDSNNSTVLIRTVEPDGSNITTPSVLSMDADIDTVLTDVAFGSQLLADVAVASDGRIGFAFVDFNGGPSDIRVAFFDSSRVPQNAGNSVLVVDGLATNPAVAFAGSGDFMVVYEDMASGTGLSGATFAAGGFALNGPFEVGGGLARAGSPDIAGTSSGFVVVMTGGGDVHYQRFGTDGSATDANAVVVSADSGAQDQPAVGAQPGGAFVVAWRDELIDGGNTGIGARAFGADGVAVQDPFVLNTDTTGEQSQPSIASGTASFAVAFVSRGSARARMLSTTGDPLPNQESPPTTADFEVAASAIEVSAAAGGSTTQPVWMAVTHDTDDIFARFFPFF